MVKRFNDTGLCVPGKHYLADISAKLSQIMDLVMDGAYFTINRPRQYGKTTTAYLLSLELKKKTDYLLIEMSFEGLGDAIFQEEAVFCHTFAQLFVQNLKLHAPFFDSDVKLSKLSSFNDLSLFISEMSLMTQRKIVLIIDEIDKSSNNQLFLSFLGMLREKYLQQLRGNVLSFHSVILIGVHDIKNLKLKIRPEPDHKLNSPWNIAIDFRIDLRLYPQEIETMLQDYGMDRGIRMDSSVLAERIYYYTSGYPYLVSKMCKIVDEELRPQATKEPWDLPLIEAAFKYLVDEAYTNTLFDDLVKNLENNPQLYQGVFDIVINGVPIKYNILEPTVSQGILYGIFDNEAGFCKIHNRVFEQKIYDYILVKESLKGRSRYDFPLSKFFQDGKLQLENVLLAFQQFMRENYSNRDIEFLEREGRLLFLSFLKPIINGKGFDFKEPIVAEERRMDIVLTYEAQRYIIELKRWEGEAYHQKGLTQLAAYMDTYALQNGYLLIFDFRKNKTYHTEHIVLGNKQIFAIWV